MLVKLLFEPNPLNVAYGGLGVSKSWAFARALLIKGMQKKLRILAARETMKIYQGLGPPVARGTDQSPETRIVLPHRVECDLRRQWFRDPILRASSQY